MDTKMINMESIFDNLQKQIQDGIDGKTQSIPIGLPRLGRYANIRKRILTLLFSTTGAGKSSMLDTIILNSCLDYMKSPNSNKPKPDFQLFSMERSKELRIAKWISFICFVEQGIQLPLPKIMGWWDEKLSKEEQSLIVSLKPLIDELTNDYVTIHEGAKSPKEIYKIMKDHFEEKGEYSFDKLIDKKTGKTREIKVYNQKDENVIIIPAIDHGNLIKTTQEFPTKKQAIDKAVEFVQGFRDLEKASVFWVSQVNRNISGVSRIKDNEHELVLEDVKESGDIGDACDIAISLFDPIKYGQSSKTGYTPTDFIDKDNGSNFFRSAQILKSTYGADSLRIPLCFNGFCGQFKELPRKKDLGDMEYNKLVKSVLDKSYFLTN